MHNIESPRIDDDGIEQRIRGTKADTGPRITPLMVEANIASEFYFNARDAVYGADEDGRMDGPLSLLTFCVLVLGNGFTVTGESACASPENFDADIGMKIARANAVQKIWPLMGYQLKQQLHQAEVRPVEEPLVWPPVDMADPRN